MGQWLVLRAGRILAQVARSSQPQARVLRTACRPRNRGRSRVPAIPQFLVDSHTFPWPLPQAGHQAPMELGRDHARSAWLLQFSCRFLQSHCSLYPERRVPATGASSGPAPLAVLVQGGQALPMAPTATTMRRTASGSGSSACRTHWRSAGGSALFPQSQVASEPGAVDSSRLSTPESGSGSGLS